MAAILLVDDHNVQREALAKLLRREGYAVLSAANGAEALQQLEAQRVDLILLDLMMPVMDGFTFLKELRQRPQWQRLPVMLVTALSDQRELEPANNLGVIGCFTKGSFSFDALRRSIATLLSPNE